MSTSTESQDNPDAEHDLYVYTRNVEQDKAEGWVAWEKQGGKEKEIQEEEEATEDDGEGDVSIGALFMEKAGNLIELLCEKCFPHQGLEELLVPWLQSQTQADLLWFVANSLVPYWPKVGVGYLPRHKRQYFDMILSRTRILYQDDETIATLLAKLDLEQLGDDIIDKIWRYGDFFVIMHQHITDTLGSS